MTDPTEQAARERVQARLGLATHVTIYAIANVGFFVIWWLTGRGYPWFVWPLFGWGIGLVAHGIAYAIGPGSRVEERLAARELRRRRRSRAP